MVSEKKKYANGQVAVGGILAAARRERRERRKYQLCCFTIPRAGLELFQRMESRCKQILLLT